MIPSAQRIQWILRYSEPQSRDPYSFKCLPYRLIYGTITLYDVLFQETLTPDLGLAFTTSLPSFQTEIQFALFPFRSLLVGESLLFSFPAGTKMFQFPAYISLSGFSCENVVVFGNLGFKGRMRLTQAYRSLPRPSSPHRPSYPSISNSK